MCKCAEKPNAEAQKSASTLKEPGMGEAPGALAYDVFTKDSTRAFDDGHGIGSTCTRKTL